jgi:5'-nucleotidase
MRILLTNDDGVAAPGLKVLETLARKFSDDVWIVAPADENSGAGHSLTLSRPVRVREHGPKHYSVAGTPTDAVMMAVGVIMKDHKPDLILSGINRGANLGDDVTYSGTVSAAMEGTLAGIRSIALSQVYSKEGMGDTVPFAAAEEWGERVIAPLLTMDFAPRTLVNINFPALEPKEVKGIRSVRLNREGHGSARV